MRAATSREVLVSGAAAAAAVALPAWEAFRSRPDAAGWWAVLAGGAVAVLVLRRQHPLTLVGLSAVCYAVTQLAWSATCPYTFVVLAAHSAGYWCARPRALACATAGAAAAMYVSAVAADGPGSALANLGVVATAVVPVVVGRYRRELLHLRAANQCAAELRERARIAGEIHDRVGHELSLVSLQAATLEVDKDLTETQRGRARDVRAGIGRVGERLVEVMDLLSGREEDGDLIALVRRARDAGVRVDADLSNLRAEPGTRTIVYGVLREALTNATKHAPGAQVTAMLSRTDEWTTLVVENARQPADLTVVGRGYGLAALAERVRRIGGVLHAGPTGATFRVSATFPATTKAPRPMPPPDVPGSPRRAVARLAVPAVAMLAAVGVASAVSAYLDVRPRSMSEHTFARLEVGGPAVVAAPLLPPRQDPPRMDEFVHGPRPPHGASCRFYRSGGPAVAPPTPAYRICFRAGRVVAADRVQYYPKAR